MAIRVKGLIRRFISLPGEERLLLTEALTTQLAVWILLKMIPFKLIPGIFSNPKITNVNREDAGTIEAKTFRDEQRITFLLRDAIRRSSRLYPWQNKCLISSLTARCMLRRRKIESRLYLGVAKTNEGKLIAHAWLDSCHGEIVASGGNYHKLYQF